MKLESIGVAIVAAMVAGNVVRAAELPRALVDPYLRAQVALAEDRVEGLAAMAQSIETAAAALGPDASALAGRAKALAGAGDIAAARAAFGELTKELLAYADKTKATFGPDVRLAYCPMVDKSWLQKHKEIRNPYYGAGMLTCGNFKS